MEGSLKNPQTFSKRLPGPANLMEASNSINNRVTVRLSLRKEVTFLWSQLIFEEFDRELQLSKENRIFDFPWNIELNLFSRQNYMVCKDLQGHRESSRPGVVSIDFEWGSGELQTFWNQLTWCIFQLKKCNVLIYNSDNKGPCQFSLDLTVCISISSSLYSRQGWVPKLNRLPF